MRQGGTLTSKWSKTWPHSFKKKALYFGSVPLGASTPGGLRWKYSFREKREKPECALPMTTTQAHAEECQGWVTVPLGPGHPSLEPNSQDYFPPSLAATFSFTWKIVVHCRQSEFLSQISLSCFASPVFGSDNGGFHCSPMRLEATNGMGGKLNFTLLACGCICHFWMVHT